MQSGSSSYKIVLSRYHTEKARVLELLKTNTSNPSVARCKNPKYVFVVDRSANKTQIAEAIESIYKDQKVKVKSVNIINTKPKPRRVRGRFGFTSSIKKAIVTLAEGDLQEGNV